VYAINQRDLDELLTQARFELFVSVEFAADHVIASDPCASSLERSLHEFKIEGIEI